MLTPFENLHIRIGKSRRKSKPEKTIEEKEAITSLHISQDPLSDKKEIIQSGRGSHLQSFVEVVINGWLLRYHRDQQRSWVSFNYRQAQHGSHASHHLDKSSSMGSGFFVICFLHSLFATTCGALMMFYLKEISVFGHGSETANKILGSTPHDQLLIQISDSFAGLLLFVIGFILFMVSFVKDHEFQTFFAKGCIVLHGLMALWRICFERRLEDLASDWPRQLVGDIILSLSWVFFLVYSWREKYD